MRKKINEGFRLPKHESSVILCVSLVSCYYVAKQNIYCTALIHRLSPLSYRIILYLVDFELAMPAESQWEIMYGGILVGRVGIMGYISTCRQKLYQFSLECGW